MTDTQWSRFEVFQQNRPEGPHQNIGSVHAPDAEMALLNARDVFVRRPSCHSLWVVPEDEIFSMTDQELRENPPQPDMVDAEESLAQTFYVFQKVSQRRSMVYVSFSGQVQANNPVRAMAKAVETFGDVTTYVWWVCPEKAILRSLETDVATMFDPAVTKTYRHPREYKVVTTMQDVKRSQHGEKDE